MFNLIGVRVQREKVREKVDRISTTCTDASFDLRDHTHALNFDFAAYVQPFRPQVKKKRLISRILHIQEMGKKETTAPTDSHMLSHCSTNAALTSLTLEIKRDPVFSSRYGRR